MKTILFAALAATVLSIQASTAAQADETLWTGQAVCGSGSHTMEIKISAWNLKGTFDVRDNDRSFKAQGTFSSRDSSMGHMTYSSLEDKDGPIGVLTATSIWIGLGENGPVDADIMRHVGTFSRFSPCVVK